jgi:hypothetical protein
VTKAAAADPRKIFAEILILGPLANVR